MTKQDAIDLLVKNYKNIVAEESEEEFDNLMLLVKSETIKPEEIHNYYDFV